MLAKSREWTKRIINVDFSILRNKEYVCMRYVYLQKAAGVCNVCRDEGEESGRIIDEEKCILVLPLSYSYSVHPPSSQYYSDLVVGVGGEGVLKRLAICSSNV